MTAEEHCMDALTLDGLKNHLGLVPMEIVDPFYAPYQQGQIAGFAPDEAATLIRRKIAVPLKDGKAVKISLPGEKPAPNKGAGAPTVEIPTNIFEVHHLQRIYLAKQLRGDDRPISDAEAKEVIGREIERRARENTANGTDEV
jgi:hypothetical protein